MGKCHPGRGYCSQLTALSSCTGLLLPLCPPGQSLLGTIPAGTSGHAGKVQTAPICREHGQILSLVHGIFRSLPLLLPQQPQNPEQLSFSTQLHPRRTLHMLKSQNQLCEHRDDR